MSAQSYLFEHFYHGQVLHQGKPQGELRLLASSAGIKPEDVNEAMSLARIPPMAASPTGSWTLVRGQKNPFIFGQSQFGTNGEILRHFVLLPVDVLRAMGGNLRALSRLVEPQMTAHLGLNATIPSLPFSNAAPAADEAQQNAMLALLTATRDRFDVVEALLAGIVQGVPIYIVGAPMDVNLRLGMLEGLLALLPPPARFGVTFALHTVPASQMDLQIRFHADSATPQDALTYDWNEARVSGVKVEDAYSRFIRSQLRLDTTLVIQQTKALTNVAAWRLRRGEALAEALRYGAFRMKVDNALLNNLPIEASEVAKILMEDPTVTDDLRAAYIRHLLAFALALDEMSANADLLAVVVRGQGQLERAIIDQMNAAVQTGKAERVFKATARWLTDPKGFKGMYWVELAHRSARTYAGALVQSSDAVAMNEFLRSADSATTNLEMQAIMPELLNIALPLAAKDRALAATVFELAALHLSGDTLLKLTGNRALMNQLPNSLQRLTPYLHGGQPNPAPSGLLLEVASSFPEAQRTLMTIRLGELAALSSRTDLLDNSVRAALAAAAATSWGERFDGALRTVVRFLSTDDNLNQAEYPGTRLLLQILLARLAYADLYNELQHQSRLLYAGEKQLNFAAMVRSLFAETTLPLDEVPLALKTLSAKGLKPLPLTMAYFGALEHHLWPASLDSVVAELTALIFGNRLLIEAIQIDLLMELFNYYAQKRDVGYTIRIAGLLPAATSRRAENGIAPLVQMYKAMTWDESVRASALETLRRYIRRSSETFAPQAVTRLGRELGEGVRQALEVTHALRLMMGGENLSDYAKSLHILAQFLYDTGIAYNSRGSKPMMMTLIGDLDSMNGGLSADERRAIPPVILEMGRQMLALSAQHRQRRPKETPEQIDLLLAGQGSAQSALDVFRVIGGYFARGRRLSSQNDRALTEHPLADRAAPTLLQELQAINRVLTNAQRVYSGDGKLSLSAPIIQSEIESLWGDIALHERRTMVRDLAIDLQRIPEMLLLITERADARLFQEDSGAARRLDNNRQRPETTLEFYRFVYGYFRARVR